MSLLTLENVTASPIVAGDAGVILKEDGTFRVFNTHTDLDPTNLTPAQLDQGRKLMALALALNVPRVMDILLDLANDKTLVGEALNLGPLN